MITPSPCLHCLTLAKRLAEARAERDKFEDALTAYVRAHELRARTGDKRVQALAVDQARLLALEAWGYDSQ